MDDMSKRIDRKIQDLESANHKRQIEIDQESQYWAVEAERIRQKSIAYQGQLFDYLNGLYVPTLLKNMRRQVWKGRGSFYNLGSNNLRQAVYRLGYISRTAVYSESHEGQGGGISTTHFNPPLRGYQESYIQISTDRIGSVTIKEGNAWLVGTREINWFVDGLFPQSFRKSDLIDSILGEQPNHGPKDHSYDKRNLIDPTWPDIDEVLVDIGAKRKLNKRFPY